MKWPGFWRLCVAHLNECTADLTCHAQSNCIRIGGVVVNIVVGWDIVPQGELIVMQWQVKCSLSDTLLGYSLWEDFKGKYIIIFDNTLISRSRPLPMC